MSDQPAVQGLDAGGIAGAAAGPTLPEATLASVELTSEGLTSAGLTSVDHTSAEHTPPMAHRASFAHESEAELARILDFYAVQWQYEPHTYPILWDLDGAVLESFSPDFYLPDLDMYLELTTLKQRLVRKKNRKLRRLRELYPDIRIKLFYARDFRMLMLKYGKLALADALSGTLGQVVPAGRNDALPEIDGPPERDVPVDPSAPGATGRTARGRSRTISMSATTGPVEAERHPDAGDVAAPSGGEERAGVRGRRTRAVRRPTDSADRRSEAAAP